MNEAAPKPKEPKMSLRGLDNKPAPPARGDVTFIRVPLPPATAFNSDRPIGLLIQAQLQHIHLAESARLRKEKRDGRSPEDIHTEAEAAAYITAVTKILHPQGRKKSRVRASK